MIVVRILLIILLSPFYLLARLLGIRRPPLMHLPEDHQEMAAAIEAARATLPEFRRLLQAPEPGMGDFGIKAKFASRNGHEHCWVGELQVRGTAFVGKLTVEPQFVPDLALGSRVEVGEDVITDWAYSKDGVFQGHYTTRVLVPRMAPRLREQVLKIYGWSAEEFTGAST